MIYLIGVGDNSYLVCFTRIGDSHYTFSETDVEAHATTFDFKAPAEHALKAYLAENKGATAEIKTRDGARYVKSQYIDVKG